MQLLEIKRLRGELGVIHFVGIGGIGMSGIAEIMHNLGYKVTGSDINTDSSNISRLEQLGIEVKPGHYAENINNVEVVVISSAITEENTEVSAARAKGIPVIKRAEMLAELMRFKTSIAISGTHGKTTTTSLIGHLFQNAGLEPTVINGGIINQYSSNARLGEGPYLVAEADESDETFIRVPADIAVITNIEAEHMDYYKSFDNYVKTFETFIKNLPFYGYAVACIDDEEVSKLARRVNDRTILTYSINYDNAHVRAINITQTSEGCSFDVVYNLPYNGKSGKIEGIKLNLIGDHNISNALAGITVALEMNFKPEDIKYGLINFSGVKRRFNRLGYYNGALIIDDYAHHPTEINATIEAAQNFLKTENNKIINIFQPHKYSRSRELFSNFIEALSASNVNFILDTHPAGESPIEGYKADNFVQTLKARNGGARHITSYEDLKQALKEVARPGDVLLFMGAGAKVTKWARDLSQELEVTYIEKPKENISV